VAGIKLQIIHTQLTQTVLAESHERT